MKKAFVVAVCVGSLLTLINQFEALFGDARVNSHKLVLTYMVPFCVYLIGMYSAKKESRLICENLPDHLKIKDEIAVSLESILRIGAMIGNLATHVNSASGSRLEVATHTQASAENATNIASAFSEKLNRIYKQIISISDDTQGVLNNFDSLISHVKSSAKWSEDRVTTIEKFREQFSAMLAKADSISNISKRTRLLSFNASIEAAKAGAAGKGFSIVADEIKFLSDNTEMETKNIKEILGQLDNAVAGITQDTHDYQQMQVKCINEVSGGEGDIRELKAGFNNMLAETRADTDDMLRSVLDLRKSMLSIQSGMNVLLDGAKASIAGSSKNMGYSKEITDLVEIVMRKWGLLPQGNKQTQSMKTAR